MANLVVTFENNYVKVDTGIYASTLKSDFIYVRKDRVEEVELEESSDAMCFYLNITKYKKWRVSYSPINDDLAFVIDSIDGVTPTDNDHLLTLIMTKLNV